MNGYLLDTNILIDWIRHFRRSRPKNEKQRFCQESAKELIESLILDDQPLFTSCHTLKELLQYPHLSIEEEARIIDKLPRFVGILSTTADVAQVAGMLSRQSYEYREHHIEDCYIAATAIHYKLPLLTRNPDDYHYVEHPDLKISVPYQEP
ncbi:type II toxin-antitoxin system VapC family toxin [Heliorestis convoluta]|uniref:Type II toxin-antitoxin system VapC family toxin n=1 Tax=Heliorestis convoluta TaxID=356322 RepID=A0A5Q2MXE1_9FIRM|nr:PIN domain-containing protein [Heliorestis convoluta]QGG47364.1 type II toxin-antitoxin system VapC family toxin [Heliorestis convoluta]